MSTLAAISDQSAIDPGWVNLLLALGLAILLLLWLWLDLQRAGHKIDAALPDLLDPPAPLRERCAVLTCTERGTEAYGDYRVCKVHDPLATPFDQARAALDDVIDGGAA